MEGGYNAARGLISRDIAKDYTEFKNLNKNGKKDFCITDFFICITLYHLSKIFLLKRLLFKTFI
jgi:hypothetical protein